MSPERRWPLLAAAVLGASVFLASGCAARRLELPTGPGRPFPGFEAAFDEATARCRSTDTMTAELGVSGRVGGRKLRGRVLAGFSRPSSLRLEGLAPFGPPAFILVSTGGEATLLLPRDPAVLQSERPDAIIEALVGLPLTPATLQGILSGCGMAESEPVSGTSFAEGWARVEGAGGVATFLRQDEGGGWSVQAAVEGSLRVEYTERSDGAPRRVRLELEGAEPRTELSLRVADVDRNVPLGDEAFEIRIPPAATPITLEDLRRAGPLGPR